MQRQTVQHGRHHQIISQNLHHAQVRSRCQP
jgi:hypothetical protein